MLDESEKERWTRRGFLGASSAALAAGMLAADNAGGQSQDPAPKAKNDRSRSEPVPKNAALDESAQRIPVTTPIIGEQHFHKISAQSAKEDS